MSIISMRCCRHGSSGDPFQPDFLAGNIDIEFIDRIQQEA